MAEAGRGSSGRALTGTATPASTPSICLKRITPLEDVVAPPWIFPATGKPAFEVPEECAKPYVMP